MTGRSPARLLAPVALVASAIALFAVVSSGSSTEDPGEPSGSSGRPAATATPERERQKERRRSRTRTYTVEPGDTPSGIAEELDVDVDALLEANPDADPSALTVGDELKVP